MTLTPGPSNIMSMNNAKVFGFKKSIVFNLGLFTGFLIVTALCVVLSSALYAIIPRIQLPMKIFGAAFMVYLAVKTLFPSKIHKESNKTAGFAAGVLLQFINPKVILSGIAIFSSYILPYYTDMRVLALFAVLLSFIGFLATLCWALFGSLLNTVFASHGKLLNVIMALLLLYCAVTLLL
jgi:threonine/homoserine/homoserine lactone efflux protein